MDPALLTGLSQSCSLNMQPLLETRSQAQHALHCVSLLCALLLEAMGQVVCAFPPVGSVWNARCCTSCLVQVINACQWRASLFAKSLLHSCVLQLVRMMQLTTDDARVRCSTCVY